jgi:hypothetical protein
MHWWGADQLTSALFLSGAASLGTARLFGRLSRGQRAATVNFYLSLVCVVLWGVLVAPLLVKEPRHVSPDDESGFGNVTAADDGGSGPLVDAALALRAPAAFVMYLAQDLLTNIVMMQSSSLSQATLNAYSGKRLIGLVNLGCSAGAVFTGQPRPRARPRSGRSSPCAAPRTCLRGAACFLC